MLLLNTNQFIKEQAWNNSFHMKWPNGDKWRVKLECDQLWVTMVTSVE